MKTRNEVQNQLRDNNLNPTKMANELQVNTNAIYFVLSGKMTSKRIQEYLEKTLNAPYEEITTAWNNKEVA